MDRLDLAILRDLAYKPLDPLHAARGILHPWDIARRLGVHGNTVKSRIDGLRELGVLTTVHCIPLGSLLGIRSAVFRMRFPSAAAKRKGVERAFRSDVTGDIQVYVGDEAWVAVLCGQSERVEQRAELLGDAIGAADVELLYERTGPIEPPEVSLLDLRILEALLLDALRPISEVADAVGVSVKTARNHFRRLADARAFFLIPRIAIGRIQGFIPFVVAAHLDPSDADAHGRFLNAFPDAFYRSTPTYPNGYVWMAADTFAEVEDALERARGAEGVVNPRVLHPLDTWAEQENMLRFLRARIREREQLPIS